MVLADLEAVVGTAVVALEVAAGTVAAVVQGIVAVVVRDRAADTLVEAVPDIAAAAFLLDIVPVLPAKALPVAGIPRLTLHHKYCR